MIATLLSARIGAIASLIAGVIMMGWIVGEYLLISQIRFTFSNLASDWQQGLFFVVGFVMAILAFRVMSGGHWRGLLHTAYRA